MAKTDNTSAKGRAGEETAVAFLQSHGYRLVARNVRLPTGEIDAICIDGTTLVFVEVKRRDGTRFGSAVAAVGGAKRAKLRALAAEYAQIVAPTARIRFDVVALDGNRVTLHRNAF